MADKEIATIETSSHDQHCFVVMPFGRNAEERKWFSGWYEVVIKPAIETCGYRSILAAAEDQPGAINDEIRAHLALDPMVIVDLAGRTPEDQPNPNVMYELGIRHAFGLPVVVMAWEGQALPFDVGNQRAIMSQRGFKDISLVKTKLVSFIESAKAGKFYRPMEAVGREAALDNAALMLGEDSALSALIDEVRYLKQSVTSLDMRSIRPVNARRLTVKSALGKSLKSELWDVAKHDELDSGTWSKFLSMKLDEELFQDAKSWDLKEWSNFLSKNKPLVVEKKPENEAGQKTTNLTAEFLDIVDEMLGPQPWEKGEARSVAEKLDASVSQVSKAIKELMSSGRRKFQHRGQVFETQYEYLEAIERDDL